jgi:integrase
MAGKQAKTLSTDHIDDLLFFAERSRHPLRNRLVVLLSVKAGLRAAEIAKLTWAMLLDPSGEVGSTLEVRDEIAKKRAAAQFRFILSSERFSSRRVGSVRGMAPSFDPSAAAQ